MSVIFWCILAGIWISSGSVRYLYPQTQIIWHHFGFGLSGSGDRVTGVQMENEMVNDPNL